MSWPENILVYGVFLLLAHVIGADVMVQLNINRPINDVSDKFVSFSIKPEDLFKALDSSNRKTITRMASMLSNSHVKFVGDYYFAAKTEGIRLRNPTKIVWKGFNKWTKAVNWSMIIPVPYKPDNWDPMETLQILNTSHMVDIDEAIWQLGTDFGFSRAADYVSELKTFNIMVDSFKQSAINWQTMGADISAGSSPEETRRYVEMSRELNAAYGWIQSNDLLSSNNMPSPLDGQDPALRVLFKAKVPVWLSLRKKKTFALQMDDEVVDGLNWAQTMGEAANIGFASIFKPLTLEDMETPKYGFYVTVLFKKIMGSRVYPARPLALFGRNNKLYTHCANMVSGGLAFMVVNQQEQPLQIAIRSMNRLQEREVWQYTLTMQDGHVMLNNNKLYVNSTLMPEVRRNNAKSMLQLKTPGLSVSFWVLPNANLEHCHFTEVETPVVQAEHSSQKIKRYSSSDRLLKELIKEKAKPSFSPLAGLMRRHRRSADKDDRFKRFVLESNKGEVKPFVNLAGNLVQELKYPLKREIFSPERRIAAIDWLSNIFKEPFSFDLPLLKRNARQSDSLKGPFFMTRDGKRTAFTKKITEIKKPEKKVKKVHLQDQEFDEEKFFKNVGQQGEPEYVRVPEGDVFLSNIASINGDDPEEELRIESQKPNKAMIKEEEIISEMRPLRLLPTEFFEALPAMPAQPLASKPNFGSALNSLLFSDLLGENSGRISVNKFGKNFNEEDFVTKEIYQDMAVEAESNDEYDAMKTHANTHQKVLHTRTAAEDDDESITKDGGHLLDDGEEVSSKNARSLPINSTKTKTDNGSENESKSVPTNTANTETPWWDLSSKRSKRSLDTSWNNNMLNKDVDPMTAAGELSPTRLRHFEHNVEEVVRNSNSNSKNENDDEMIVGKKIVNTFKEQVTKLVDIFSHHANEWYNTLTQQLDNKIEEPTTTEGNRLI